MMQAWVIAVFTAAAVQAAASAPPVRALPSPFTIGEVEFRAGNYLAPIRELRSHEAAYVAGDRAATYHEALGTYLSYVGDYRGALAEFGRGKPSGLPPVDKAVVDDTEAVDAVEAIAAQARHSRAIFINEKHHVPKHRVLTRRLLKRLYAEGVRYFTAETLNASDAGLMNRRFPRLDSGFYLAEPQYADLVREALAIGYKVIPYEYQGSGEVQNVREKGQAENLKRRIFDADPQAKVLVHAGYGHIDEQGVGDWVPMARYFKELTGIDPVTVNQIDLDEAAQPALEHRAYVPLLARHNPVAAVALRSLKSRTWSTIPYIGHYDIQVLHPRSIWRDGRPTWLSRDTGRKVALWPPAWPHVARRGPWPLLLQAFAEREVARPWVGLGQAQAVPVDQVIVTQADPLPSLVLAPGRYVFKLRDESGRVTREERVTVKP